MKPPTKTFPILCKDLYETLLEKAWERLCSRTTEITRKYSSSGFTAPPGPMYAEIGKCYREDLPIRAEIIFDSCCQAYRASASKLGTGEFTKELLDAIRREQDRILASGEGLYNQYNAQFMIPSYHELLERYKNEVLSEGRRLLRYYSSKAIVFLGESAASTQIDNPLELKPNFWGIGIDLRKIVPWVRKKFRK
jgi:hypothetical protein